MEVNDDQLMIRGSDHPLTLVKELDNLRKNEEFCDVKILVGSKSFPAHRCVLSSACAYFRLMFSSGLTECQNDEIQIFGIVEGIFDFILTYIYTGNVTVSADDVQDLLIAANMLQISNLKSICSDFLESRITKSNCIGLYAFAEMHDCQQLNMKSKLFMTSNFVEIFKFENEEFLQMDCQRFSQLLSSEDLKIESERQVLICALQWITRQTPFSSEQASALLSKVRFPLLAYADIDRCIQDTKTNLAKISDQKSKDLVKIEKICKNYRKLQISVKYNGTTRKGAMKFLYIIGGYRSPQRLSWLDGDWLSGTEKFDFETGKSNSSLPLMNEAKSSHVAAVVGGSIMVFGGDCESLLLDIIEVYNPNLNSWSKFGKLSMPRCGFGVAVVEENVFLIGGCIGSKLTKDIDRYDIKTNTMEKIGELLEERAYFGSAVCNGNVYVSGNLINYSNQVSMVSLLEDWTSKGPKTPAVITFTHKAVDKILNIYPVLIVSSFSLL